MLPRRGGEAVLPVRMRFDVTAEVPAADDLGAVHFIAIGGIGMSGVARLMLASGVTVSGSDASDSPVLRALATEGARVSVGHEAGHLEGVDTVVVSSAVKEDNVELASARARGLRVLHRSQALAALLGDRTRVAIAGANGKTTTTSMLTIALRHTGADPSFAAGGELATLGTNAHLGEGDAFVVEADESDGSFLAYRPHLAVVTNVQPDHLDFYETFENVQQAYATFVRSMPDGGLLVACADDAGAASLADAARAEGRRVVTYGFDASADVRLSDEEGEGLAASAYLADGGGVRRTLRLTTPGHHNLLNAAAAWTAATSGLGADPDAILDGLHAYGGTRRRFEVVGQRAGVTVVDDYAHNPGKVSAVVRTAARLASGGRLVVIFQPHLYSRTRDFADAFARGLEAADRVLLLDVYGAREDPVAGVTSELIAAPLRRSGTDVEVVTDRASVPDLAVAGAGVGDVVLTVGAGDVTRLAPAILDALGRT